MFLRLVMKCMLVFVEKVLLLLLVINRILVLLLVCSLVRSLRRFLMSLRLSVLWM